MVVAWSLTKLKTFLQCGAKYDYRYNQRLPDISSLASQRGTQIHATLAGFIAGTNPLEGPLEFYHGFLTALKDSAVPLYTEKKIALRQDWTAIPDSSDEKAWFVGYLDLYRETEDHANYWDWKTGKIYPDHLEDMEVYALAVMAAKPRLETVTAIYAYVDKGQKRERTFVRQAEYDTLKEKWSEKVRRMEGTTQFIPNPQFMCRYCPYSRAQGGPCPF
jgi:hypothetical protein